MICSVLELPIRISDVSTWHQSIFVTIWQNSLMLILKLGCLGILSPLGWTPSSIYKGCQKALNEQTLPFLSQTLGTEEALLQKTRLPLVFPLLGWVLCPVSSASRPCLPPIYFFYPPSTFFCLLALPFLLYTFLLFKNSPLVIPPLVPAVEATMRYTSLPSYHLT